MKNACHRFAACMQLAAVAVLYISCARHTVDEGDVEKAHGLKLPQSARNLQQKQLGGYLDHGILSMFEVDQNDVDGFLDQLEIASRDVPAITGVGDPCLNGWNVWPTNAATFVPGNTALNGLRCTWTGDAKPVEMISCGSSEGDWLHVEVWSVGDHALIKLYTDWN